MSKVPVSPPSGFRDFLPAEADARSRLVEIISAVYRSRGFQAIGMPMLENLSTLQGKGGGSDNEKLIFKVLKRGEELQRAMAAGAELADMGLRFDLTLPLARYYSRFREQLSKPFKVFQIGPVWRADRPQKGRFREFFQCDVDIVGAKEIGAEVDCIGAILEVFAKLALNGVEVHLNDRRLLSALGEKTGISKEAWSQCLISLDKLDKMESEKVKAEMLEILRQNQAASGAEELLDRFLFSGKGDWHEINPEADQELSQLAELLRASAPGFKVVVNRSLVRGQDYYTGTIFELRHPELSGSLAGGGRYNRLLEVFGGPETPAFGGSIGFERLYLLLQEGHTSVSTDLKPQVFFPLFDPSLRGPVLALAAQLREAGIRTDIFPDAAKLKQQFKYADDRGIPFTLILGSDEWNSRQIKVKSMASRSEETLPLEPRPEFVKRMMELCNPQNTA